MYKIFADDTLIYDSTLSDYKLGKGLITLESDKSGSFVFSLYPDHFYYDGFVQMRTVTTVYKSDRIVFRGRVLEDAADYWNNKTATCEGELGFLQDSVIRPYNVTGTPEDVFRMYIEAHNAQVNEFKRFKIGTCTVVDANGYITRSNANYASTLDNISEHLLGSTSGGHLYITHGEDGRDPIPTIHYLADFPKTATQGIEFGINLKNYAKTTRSADIATAIIPLGAVVDDGNSDTEDPRLNIKSVNNGLDYVYSPAGVALRGWITKPVEWDDVTDAKILKSKGEEYVESAVNSLITVELTALDLHLLDRSIESYNVCEYIPVSSKPHGFSATLLCKKQTLDLLQPGNDTVTLGHTYSTFTEKSTRAFSTVASVNALKASVSSLSNKINTGGSAITEVITRLENLESVTLVTIQVTATDAVRQLTTLLSSAGTLTVSGQSVTKSSTSLSVNIGNSEVRYTLATNLSRARIVKVNGVEIGTVSVAGDTVATVLNVTNGSTVAVEFIGG